MTRGMITYFTADEFLLCCAAVGMKKLCGFTPPKGASALRGASQALFSLLGRDYLLYEGGGFALCPDLLKCFRTLRDSGQVVLGYQLGAGRQAPCRLLYGSGDCFVSLTPGSRQEDYVGLEEYEDEAEWLLDAGLAPAEAQPDNLTALTGLEPERDAVIQMLKHFAAGGPAPDHLPEPVIGCLESRRILDWHLTGRVCLVRQALFDCVIVGAEGRATDEIYRPDRLAKLVRDMRIGRMELL